METFQCERCFKEEEHDRHNLPDGWYRVPDNVSVYLCTECLEQAAKAYLPRFE
jgi:hypothetical protein